MFASGLEVKDAAHGIEMPATTSRCPYASSISLAEIAFSDVLPSD
jgi:hypothetical protein